MCVYVCVCVCVCVRLMKDDAATDSLLLPPVCAGRRKKKKERLKLWLNLVQGGGDEWDALSCRSLFAKEPLIIGLFCGK